MAALAAWAAAWALSAAGCGATGEVRRGGGPVDEGWDARPVASAPREPARPLPGFDELRAWPTAARVTTAHPGRARRAALQAGPGAEAYGRRGRAPFAAGASLLATLESSDGGPVLAHYLMRKQEAGYFPEGGDWQYGVVSPRGEVLAEGRLGLCARCHAEATREHVFEPVVVP